MYGLPRETHTYFVEAISERPHLKTILINRFLNFIRQIEKSKKCAIKKVLKTIKYDTQSVTGKNLKEIMFLVEKNDVCDLIPENAMKIAYKKIPESEEWRVSLLNELIEVKLGECLVEGFSETEINDLQQFVCNS